MRPIVNIYVNGVLQPHYKIGMRGDGACLFYSIARFVYGTETLGAEVREEIVTHVFENFERYAAYSNYCIDAYAQVMSKPYEYGTELEIQAAAALYNFKFEVFENERLITQYGEEFNNFGRLLFSGSRQEGHFDCLFPVEVQSNTETTKCLKRKSRVRFSNEKRRKQHQISVKNYAKKNPNVNRRAVAKYSKENPKVNRRAVAKYSKENPEVNRRAVSKYLEENPYVHRKAVVKYSEENPDVNRKAVAKYSKIKQENWISKLNSALCYSPSIPYELDACVNLGEMASICKWCNALKWKDESTGLCCNSGKVSLAPLQQPPEPLYSLLRNEHPDSSHFLKQIRRYNSSFQMTSFGGKEIREGHFMPSFKIQGQVYHRIGSLLPQPEAQPKFLQIYFVGDDDKEADLRCKAISSLKKSVIMRLQGMLHCSNEYVKFLKAAIQAVPEDKEFKVVINSEKKPNKEHKGRFNAPAVDEVAAIIVGNVHENRDIILRGRNNTLQRISTLHRAYDTLQYPLMFPYAEDGYTIDVCQIDPQSGQPVEKTVSSAQFYTHRMMQRKGVQNNLLYFRNLFNQYLVDMYAKIEGERLQYIRNNQKKLRVENYVQLQDAIKKSDAAVQEIGKRVFVLPSSFTGGPRYLHERTQDAMTYVRHYGRPDLFITFTCSPKWEDISTNLFDDQKAFHRHDLIARVFHLKVKKLMTLITKGGIFGEQRCHMFTIEWQKRGLPHVHILLWLKKRIPLNDIDSVISAEIPDRGTDPKLYEIVKANMIHGPCSALNQKSTCMVNGSCSKHYPKELMNQTQTGKDGYPNYKRRAPKNGGFTVNINGVDLDNRWVVPFNPVLLRLFNAHINVEYCNSIKSIKYVCKYINKGSDQATFAVMDDMDEISAYETGRYISSSEAVWRILCFPIHERFPPVMHLSVHLENGQRIYFTKENIIEKIKIPPKTTLMAFFDLCKTDDYARTLLYNEVPAYYVWRNGSFYRRKKGDVVPDCKDIRKDNILGRVYTVHPNNSECYYLRILLHEVRGPTSFQDIKTVDGVVHPTFQSACRALGLLEDDEHWNHTLEDAAISDSPYKLRELFAIMLVFCNLSDPLLLWNNHKDIFSEDIARKFQMKILSNNVEALSDQIHNEALILLEDIVVSISTKCLKDYGLPSPLRSVESNLSHAYLMEKNYDTDKLAENVLRNEPLLNEDQKRVYDKVIESIESETGNVFFLDAPGGTGKTFLLNLLLAKIRSESHIAIAVASSGIAATLLDNGRTAHSAFKLPLNMNYIEEHFCNISKQSDMAHLLRECKLIVWDECSMSNKGAIEALDRSLRDLRNCKRFMGGLTVLLSGDFRQTLPVVPRGTRADEVKACLKSSNLWKKIKILHLRRNMRVHLTGDSESDHFAKMLLALGDGKLEEKEDKIEVPTDLCQLVRDVVMFTNLIYPNLSTSGERPDEWFRDRIIMTSKNDTALELNDLLLQRFQGAQKTYKSVDTVVEVEDTVNYPVEFLNTLNPPGMPPHMLNLKVGAPIMLLRNFKPPKLCNGTRLKITALYNNVIEATIITGCGTGETVLIPRIPLIPSDYPFDFKRLQFPLKVCFAITINKCQGQTLKVAGVDLREDCFSHGQLYVAFSRVSSKKNLYVLQPEGKTRNVVYPEVLRN